MLNRVFAKVRDKYENLLGKLYSKTCFKRSLKNRQSKMVA